MTSLFKYANLTTDMDKTDEFLNHLISGWGERELYSVNEEEANTLISFGASKENRKDNEDGTFSTQLELRGKKFLLISTEEPK